MFDLVKKTCGVLSPFLCVVGRPLSTIAHAPLLFVFRGERVAVSLADLSCFSLATGFCLRATLIW